eukprot:RCo009555
MAALQPVLQAVLRALVRLTQNGPSAPSVMPGAQAVILRVLGVMMGSSPDPPEVAEYSELYNLVPYFLSREPELAQAALGLVVQCGTPPAPSSPTFDPTNAPTAVITRVALRAVV